MTPIICRRLLHWPITNTRFLFLSWIDV